MNTTPDRQLKEKIIEAIKKEGLLREADVKKLEDNYLQKEISIEDWERLVENRILKEEMEAKDAQPG